MDFLYSVLDMNGANVLLATNELVAVEREFIDAAVANLSVDASTIVSAVDYLISGY
ncbi:MAG: CcdB family protein [Burkholderiaceae bacterium]